MSDHTKQMVLGLLSETELKVYTDPVASPTGFPFKVLELDDTLSVKKNYEERPRVCNLGYNPHAHPRPSPPPSHHPLTIGPPHPQQLPPHAVPYAKT